MPKEILNKVSFLLGPIPQNIPWSSSGRGHAVGLRTARLNWEGNQGLVSVCAHYPMTDTAVNQVA